MSVYTIDGVEYEEVPRNAILLSNMITNAFVKLGRPNDPLSPNGRKIVKIVLAAWEDLYPNDVVEWKQVRDDYQKNEMSITEQVHKSTGRSLGSYPAFVYYVLCKLFPEYKFTERANMMAMVKAFPLFRFANKV